MEPEQAIRNGLALMVTAFRQDVDAPQVRAYLRVLKGIPADVLLEGADRLCAEPGRRFFPTTAEWSGACAGVIDERRKAAARTARALREDCPDCHGSGFRDAEGPNQVTQCSCVKRAAEVMRLAPATLRALPPSSDPEAA